MTDVEVREKAKLIENQERARTDAAQRILDIAFADMTDEERSELLLSLTDFPLSHAPDTSFITGVRFFGKVYKRFPPLFYNPDFKPEYSAFFLSKFGFDPIVAPEFPTRRTIVIYVGELIRNQAREVAQERGLPF